MDDLLTWAVLAVAGFGAGVLNAMAGGGTFLTFPALVWAGVPPIAANATSAQDRQRTSLLAVWTFASRRTGNSEG